MGRPGVTMLDVTTPGDGRERNERELRRANVRAEVIRGVTIVGLIFIVGVVAFVCWALYALTRAVQ